MHTGDKMYRVWVNRLLSGLICDQSRAEDFRIPDFAGDDYSVSALSEHTRPVVY